jgi:hypothetical protein
MKGDESGKEEGKGYKYLRDNSVKLTREGSFRDLNAEV